MRTGTGGLLGLQFAPYLSGNGVGSMHAVSKRRTATHPVRALKGRVGLGPVLQDGCPGVLRGRALSPSRRFSARIGRGTRGGLRASYLVRLGLVDHEPALLVVRERVRMVECGRMEPHA